MARRENPEINAGSMADIAFLLLIFFLVTTTMDVDSGISKKLAEKPPADYVPPKIKMKNIFEISINRNNELFVQMQSNMTHMQEQIQQNLPRTVTPEPRSSIEVTDNAAPEHTMDSDRPRTQPDQTPSSSDSNNDSSTGNTSSKH